MTTPEAPLEDTGDGLVPRGEGWFVLNARDALWQAGVFGAYTRFEGDPHFPALGINLNVLPPGTPACMYHREEEQEGFLVLRGDCLLLVEGEERRLRAWDFFHCPAGTDHVLVGGEEECLILAVGSRTGGGVVYPRSELALRHRAGVETETTASAEAYADCPPDTPTRPREDLLPEL